MNRIGLLLPSTNTTMEPDFYRLIPKDITVHSTRMALKDVTPKSLEKMAEEADRAAWLLATANMDVLVYGCTSGSLIRGVKWEQALVQRLHEVSKIPVVTTAGAVIEALRFIEAKNIQVVTPYTEPVNRLEKEFLQGYGFKVLSIKGLGLIDNQMIGKVSSSTVGSLMDASKETDCVFISCTNLPVVSMIQKLENKHGIPIITSNQASIWATLRSLGHSGVKGYGVLLSSL
jgi:maleate isomerase